MVTVVTNLVVAMMVVTNSYTYSVGVTEEGLNKAFKRYEEAKRNDPNDDRPIYGWIPFRCFEDNLTLSSTTTNFVFLSNIKCTKASDATNYGIESARSTQWIHYCNCDCHKKHRPARCIKRKKE